MHVGLPQGHDYPSILTLQVMKEWIAKRVTQLLGGLEEEVLISMIYSYLEDPEVIVTTGSFPVILEEETRTETGG